MGTGWSLFLRPEVEEEYYATLHQNCEVGEMDLSSPLICNSASFAQLDKFTKKSLATNEAMALWTYSHVKNDIMNTFAPGYTVDVQEKVFDKVWPAFYWMYDTEAGKARVDALLSEMVLPDQAVWFLKHNFHEGVQRRFAIMNAPLDTRTDLHAARTLFYAGYVWPLWVTNIRTGITTDIKKSHKEHLADATSPLTRPIVDPDMIKWQGFLRWKFDNPPETHGWDPAVNRRWVVQRLGFGNPMWDRERREEAYREMRMVSEDGSEFNDYWNLLFTSNSGQVSQCDETSCEGATYEAGRRGAHMNDPVYGGKEPSILFSANPFNFVGSTDYQQDGAGRSWTNPCDDRGPLEKYLPYIAAGVGAAVPMLFLPRNTGTYIISGGLGMTMYHMAQDSYGLDAVVATLRQNSTHADEAADFVLTALPAGAIIFVYEIGILPESLLNRNMAYIGGSGLAAFLYFSETAREIVVTSLKSQGGISALLTSPIAFIETFLLFATNGCIAQEFLVDFDCTCSEADKTGGKSGITEQLLDRIYGVTGKQRELRKDCLEQEMTRGGWASTDEKDLNVIGKCMGVVMENPFACYTAQNWVYRDPVIPAFKRTHPQEIDMWGQISHCMDPDNPSFYPPQTELDSWCRNAHGEQFRGGPGGTCLNYAMPGPNNTDEIGLQYPGAPRVDAPQSEECIIL